MKLLKNGAIALSMGLVFSLGATAEEMTKQQYDAGQKNIELEYDSAKKGCGSLAGNANDICVAEAKGAKEVGTANLEFKFKPTVKNRNKAQVAKAEADYSVASEKCDDKAGNDKDVCVKEAKAAKVHAMTDSKLQMESAKAGADAVETSADANAKALGKATGARKDAIEDQRDADYSTAKEKCDALSGSAKDSCVNNAKSRFGKG